MARRNTNMLWKPETGQWAPLVCRDTFQERKCLRRLNPRSFLTIVRSSLGHVTSTTRFLRRNHLEILVQNIYPGSLSLIYGIRSSGLGICILNKFLVWFLCTPQFEDFEVCKNLGTTSQALFHSTNNHHKQYILSQKTAPRSLSQQTLDSASSYP